MLVSPIEQLYYTDAILEGQQDEWSELTGFLHDA